MLWRMGRDSNPGAALLRPSHFECAPLGLSGTHPVTLAERKGFEPLCRIAATIRFPTGALGPLEHLSFELEEGAGFEPAEGLPTPLGFSRPVQSAALPTFHGFPRFVLQFVLLLVPTVRVERTRPKTPGSEPSASTRFRHMGLDSSRLESPSIGAAGGNRTPDARLFRPALFRLSYRGRFALHFPLWPDLRRDLPATGGRFRQVARPPLESALGCREAAHGVRSATAETTP